MNAEHFPGLLMTRCCSCSRTHAFPMPDREADNDAWDLRCPHCGGDACWCDACWCDYCILTENYCACGRARDRHPVDMGATFYVCQGCGRSYRIPKRIPEVRP